MDEVDGISIDRFEEPNLSSTTFFLSHAHTDHMSGLTTYGNFQILDHLPEDKVFIYSSPVTTQVLKEMHPQHENKFKPLEIGISQMIEIPSTKKTVTVTLLPASHCPGSVMFLFEVKNKTILYTGDFRWKLNQSIPKALCYSTGEVKTIDKMYMDTTFFFERYTKFPCRDDSIGEICKLIKDWIERGKQYQIVLATSAKYGYECVFTDIYKQVNIPIHVNQSQFDVYKYFPCMDKAITLEASNSQIHCHCNSWKSTCVNAGSQFVRQIKICAWSFSNWQNKRTISDRDTLHNKQYKVCYSTHSSYEEINNFLDALKPKEVEPNVIPDRKEDATKMYNNIRSYFKRHTKQVEQSQTDFNFTNFTSDSTKSCMEKSNVDKDEHADIFDILD